MCSVYYQPRPQLAVFSGALGLAGLWAIPSTGTDPQPLLVTYNLSDPQDLDALLHIAAQRKIAAYQQQYADNQNISFLPGIVSTSTRIHGEFLRLLFLQAHLETEAHFTAIGMSSQHINTEGLLFKCAAFYNGLKSKVGLASAKAAALRVNLNVQGCSIVAPPMHAPSRTPLLLPLLRPPSFPQSPYPPSSLVRDERTHPHRPRLVVSHSTCPPLSSCPPREQLCNRSCSNKHTRL